jgi:hypothetical protein
MIHGHVALVRQLRSFMEQSAIPPSELRYVYDYDDEGHPLLDDDRVDAVMTRGGRSVDITIWAPSTERIEGVESFPLGKLAARCCGKVIQGVIDQTTWDRILRFINEV